MLQQSTVELSYPVLFRLKDLSHPATILPFLIKMVQLLWNLRICVSCIYGCMNMLHWALTCIFIECALAGSGTPPTIHGLRKQCNSAKHCNLLLIPITFILYSWLVINHFYDLMSLYPQFVNRSKNNVIVCTVQA